MRVPTAGRLRAPCNFCGSSCAARELSSKKNAAADGCGALLLAFAAKPRLPAWQMLDECFGFDTQLVEPGMGGLEGGVDVLDVLDAGRFEPVAEGRRALLGVDGDAVFPGGASAEHAVISGAA